MLSGPGDVRHASTSVLHAAGWTSHPARSRGRGEDGDRPRPRASRRPPRTGGTPVEHRAHQQAERPAPELIVDEKLDRARRCFEEGPAIFQWLNGPSRYSTRIFSLAVERDAAGEGLADRLVGDRHVGDEHSRPSSLARGGAPSAPRRAARTADIARRRRPDRTSRPRVWRTRRVVENCGMDGRQAPGAARRARRAAARNHRRHDATSASAGDAETIRKPLA